MIERLRDFPDSVVAFARKGRVTRKSDQMQLAKAREWIVAMDAK